MLSSCFLALSSKSKKCSTASLDLPSFIKFTHFREQNTTFLHLPCNLLVSFLSLQTAPPQNLTFTLTFTHVAIKQEVTKTFIYSY